MKHAVLLTHGPIGDAIIEAVRGIMGMENGLHPLSVTNMSVAEITQRLLSLINAPEEKTDGVVILASLKGGSCWNVAVSVAKDHPHVKVISGLNLPMVLTFMTKRESYAIDELATILENDGIRGFSKFVG
jgi:mannose/fructose-specific phosphotransferase system component IIA